MPSMYYVCWTYLLTFSILFMVTLLTLVWSPGKWHIFLKHVRTLSGQNSFFISVLLLSAPTPFFNIASLFQCHSFRAWSFFFNITSLFQCRSFCPHSFLRQSFLHCRFICPRSYFAPTRGRFYIRHELTNQVCLHRNKINKDSVALALWSLGTKASHNPFWIKLNLVRSQKHYRSVSLIIWWNLRKSWRGFFY